MLIHITDYVKSIFSANNYMDRRKIFLILSKRIYRTAHAGRPHG
jgi:hypothetical protein